VVVSKSNVARFWAKVNKNGPIHPEHGQCWVWIAKLDHDGYGRFWFAGKIVGAHRFSWEQANGAIPEGLCVLHHCDNPPCVRPDHLFIGTNKDNMDDRNAKGRAAGAKGERNGRARLTVDQVRAILEDTRSGRKIAPDYGISYQQVSRIKRKEKWNHV
jgi:hypothetical protein